MSVVNLSENLRLGAALIGLDRYAEFAADRWAAIDDARGAVVFADEDTVDYPASSIEPNQETVPTPGQTR